MCRLSEPEPRHEQQVVVCAVSEPRLDIVHNHFVQERHRYSRDYFKIKRAAALGEWRELGAA